MRLTVQASGHGGIMVLKDACYVEALLVNALHPEYEAHEDWWRTFAM